DGGADRTLLSLDVLIERAAPDVVHDEVDVVVIAPAVVDRHDVGVLEQAEGFDFALKAGEALGRGSRRAAVEDFDRHLSAGGLLYGEVDDALPATVQLSQDGVAWEDWEGRSWAESLLAQAGGLDLSASAIDEGRGVGRGGS